MLRADTFPFITGSIVISVLFSFCRDRRERNTEITIDPVIKGKPALNLSQSSPDVSFLSFRKTQWSGEESIAIN